MEVPLQLQRRRRAQVRLALWSAIALLLVLVREVLFPFLVGALLAYLLHPLVSACSGKTRFGWRIPRWATVVLIYLLGILLLAVCARLVLPSLYGETVRLATRVTVGLEASSDRLQASGASVQAWLRSHGLPADPSADLVQLHARLDVGEALRGWPKAIQGRLFEFFGLGQRLIRDLFGGLFSALLILTSAAFFLVSQERIFGFVRGLLPEGGQGGLEQLTQRLDHRLSGVVRGQVTICAVNGVLTLIGLLLFQVEFPFVLAAQATGFSLIPIFGTLISSVPILIVALQNGVAVGLSMLGWILAIHALEAYLLNPKILGQAARIPPLIMLFALVAGEHYFGLAGAFLAAPVAASLVAIFEQAEAWAEGPG